MLDLAPVTAHPLLIRVETNGHFHLRYEIGHRTVDDGRCGIDDNWVLEDDLQVIAEADPEQLCRYCFPSVGA